ncbi:MAG TPA: ABC transporter permease [Thermoleophilia bacterium]|nr:ABC transporter permease [Thermoleophilia bacterium]
MGQLIARRLLLLIPTLLLLSVVVFLMLEVVPGDPGRVKLGPYASAAQVAQVDHQLGVDRPLPVRYVKWLGGFVVLHWGTSWNQGVPVFSLTMHRLWASVQLALVALVIIIPLAVVLGVTAALRRDGVADRVITVTSLSLTVVPEFVSGVVLTVLFVVFLKIFHYPAVPPAGADPLTRIYYLLLPAIPLMFVEMGYIARMARAGMIEALSMPYIRTATLNGLPRRRVVFGHALRNAMAPTVAVIGTQIGWLVGGLVIVEELFVYPGIGKLIADSAKFKDLPTLEATVLVVAVIYMISNLSADVIVALLNPRVRYGR